MCADLRFPFSGVVWESDDLALIGFLRFSHTLIILVCTLSDGYSKLQQICSCFVYLPLRNWWISPNLHVGTPRV